MAFVTLDTKKLEKNYQYLEKMFTDNDIEWAVVSKLLSGNREYLAELLKMGLKQVCDSRIINLKIIKSIDPSIETIFIKPPAKNTISNVVKYADISMNTEFKTIKLLSEEAQRQNKMHKIIIMIEMGELREGVMRDNLIQFYADVFTLSNIEVVGIGTNFSCLYGVLPSHDKMVQLSLYKQLIEALFERKLRYVSGGSSVAIPLISQNHIPKGVNHFRVGETLFLGTDLYNNGVFPEMHTDVFRLYAEVIELMEKPTVPTGEMGRNVEGHSFSFEQSSSEGTSYRAIVDLGLLDVDETHIAPVDSTVTIVGASSDMLVVDIGATNAGKYRVGSKIEFKMDYMGVLRIMNSKYVEKRII